MRLQRWKIGLIWIALMGLLSGCGGSRLQTTPIVSSSPQTNPTAVASDHEIKASPSKVSVVLYYPNNTEDDFVRVIRDVEVDEKQSLLWVTVKSLISPADGQVPIFGGRHELRDIIESRNVVIVDFYGNPRDLSEETMLAGCMALVNTLTEIQNVQYVKVLFNGYDVSPRGLIGNILIRRNENLKVLMLLHKNYLQSVRIPGETAKMLLFFKDHSSKYLLTEVRDQNANTGNVVLDVFAQLKQGPVDYSDMDDTLPSTMRLSTPPTIEKDEQGDYFAVLQLSDTSYERMKFIDQRSVLASITMSLCNTIPEINGVRIFINNKPIVSLPGYSFPNGTIPREAFEGLVGSIATLYFPNVENTHLIPVRRAIAQNQSTPIHRVYALMEGPLENEVSEITALFPPNTQPNDLLTAYMEGSTLVLNMSRGFLSRAEGMHMDMKLERLMVYGIVNTLTEFRSIQRVQILIEGQKVEGFGKWISLMDPLRRNPGLIQETP